VLWVVLALVVLLIVALIGLGTQFHYRIRDGYMHAQYRDAHPYTHAHIEEARVAALKQSRSTVTGQTAEHLAPLIPALLSEFDPRDWQWLGQPADFLIWDGLEAGGLKRLVVVEVKSGRRPRELSPKQRRVRDLIEGGEVPLEWRHVDVSDPADPKLVESRRARRRGLLEPQLPGAALDLQNGPSQPRAAPPVQQPDPSRDT
jgi:predicted Holliday junction resolvase-like endonuclease